MSVGPKAERATTTPLLKNAAAAPIIYFDNVPALGAFAGHIEVELGARMLMPRADNSVGAELTCTGHLRCSPAAAAQLVEALTRALDMINKQATAPSELLKN